MTSSKPWPEDDGQHEADHLEAEEVLRQQPLDQHRGRPEAAEDEEPMGAVVDADVTNVGSVVDVATF